MQCIECGERKNFVNISVYKRHWIFCNACGSATSGKEKMRLPLSFLPYDFLKRNRGVTEENIYDYFLSPEHQKISRKNYEFVFSLFSKFLDQLANKNIIDISGGSGHFLSFFKDKAKYVLLTEINDSAVEFAKKELKIDALKFDFNRQNFYDVLQTYDKSKKFDIVFMIACSMFCKDMKTFVSSLTPMLNDGATIVVTGNVQPTAGVVVRTQFDDYTYLILRKPDVLKMYFKEKFELLEEGGYSDWYPEYATAHDLVPLQRLLKIYYLEKAVSKLVKNQNHTKNPFFRYRDRHLFYQVFKYQKIKT